MGDYVIKVKAAPIRVITSGAQGPSGPVAMVMQTPVANVAALPTLGNTLNDGRVTEDTGDAYRWDGSEWVLVGPFRGNTGNTGSTGPQGPPGSGHIPAFVLPPEDPADGEPWLEYGTWILSYWSEEEGAWVVPTTNSIPATAFRSPSGLPYTSPSGEYYLAAAA